MELYYQFEMTIEVEDRSINYYDRIDPPTHFEDFIVDYKYHVDITDEDIAEYLGTKLDMVTQKVIDRFLKVFGGALEDDDDFIGFMTERYRDEAKRECRDEYE